jgi:hypothetical protein
MTNNDLQNTTQKTKDRAIQNPLITGGELGCSEWDAVPAPQVTTVVLLLSDATISVGKDM